MYAGLQVKYLLFLPLVVEMIPSSIQNFAKISRTGIEIFSADRTGGSNRHDEANNRFRQLC